MRRCRTPFRRRIQAVRCLVPKFGCDMRRRDFAFLVVGAAVWPFIAHAQQPGKIARIGFLGSATAAGSAKSVDAFRAGLRDLGYVEGRNIVLEFRWAEGKYDRLPDLVADLIGLNVDVIVTHGTPGTRVAKQATNAIPIVMAISGDAIATGLVTSLARPEANLTGSTFFIPQLNAKRLELLKEVFPHVRRVAALSNPGNPVSQPIIPAMQAAAMPLKLELDVARAQGLVSSTAPSQRCPGTALTRSWLPKMGNSRRALERLQC